MGYYRNGMRHGNGTYKLPNGTAQYVGEYKEDLLDGNGKFYFENGNVYVGEWHADEMNGNGIMTYANEDVYDGEWVEGRREGRGRLVYQNGDVYDGEFKNEKMHGKGVFEYADGDIFKSTGEWKEGKKCGFFENMFRPSSMQVYYEEDEAKPDPKVKLECDQDSDVELIGVVPSSKRLKVSVSPLSL